MAARAGDSGRQIGAVAQPNLFLCGHFCPALIASDRIVSQRAFVKGAEQFFAARRVARRDTRIISDMLTDSPKRWSASDERFRRRDADGCGRDDRAPREVAHDSRGTPQLTAPLARQSRLRHRFRVIATLKTIAAGVFLLLLFGCNPSSPPASTTITTNSPGPHLLTAEEAGGLAKQLGNDKAGELYYRYVFPGAAPVARLEDGHWVCTDWRPDGHGFWSSKIELALDGSTNLVDVKYVSGWLP
jgi:hypothetical protein